MFPWSRYYCLSLRIISFYPQSCYSISATRSDRLVLVTSGGTVSYISRRGWHPFAVRCSPAHTNTSALSLTGLLYVVSHLLFSHLVQVG